MKGWQNMTTLEESQRSPLLLTEEGTICVASSQVSLDSVVYHYKLGASAEQNRPEISGARSGGRYAAIAYYLSHQETVEEYLRQQER